MNIKYVISIQDLLNIPEESQNIEFKRLNWEKVVVKIIETIIAMTNTEWGMIVFWIDDPEKTIKKWLDRIHWIEENKELFDEIGREIQRIIPPIWNLWTPEYIEIKKIEKTVAVLYIPKAIQSFHSIKWHVYQRLHKWNKQLSPEEIVKLSYAKWFEKADRELVEVDFELLNTEYYKDWKTSRNIIWWSIKEILYQTWLARKDKEWVLKPTRASVLLFSLYPTNLMDTKCSIRVFQYTWNVEIIWETPNLLWIPKTIDWPIIQLIRNSNEYILSILKSWISMASWFTTKYKIPERVIKEVITNAVIHRDYFTKRDIEVKIFENRIEVQSPWLFPYNITKSNIGKVRSEWYRNDLLVKHLREFSTPPNLDQNEWVRAMINEMNNEKLYPPIYWTYPELQDSIRVILWNELQANDWNKIKILFKKEKYITNELAMEITWIIQINKMSEELKKWTNKWLLIRIPEDINIKSNVKYKLASDIDSWEFKIF